MNLKSKKRVLIFSALISIVFIFSSNIFAGTTVYIYDSLHRIEREIYPDGTEIEYEYYPNGNRKTKKINAKNLSNSLFKLKVAVSDPTRGAVTSLPAGISCGTNCDSFYNYGTSVTLTATPIEGYRFIGWTGACSGTDNCIVTIDSFKSVKANFALKPVSLTVSKPLAGLIISRPPGIVCGDDCTETFDSGTKVSLLIMPDEDYNFTGWTGDCSGTSDCSLTMDSAKNISAALAKKQFTISTSFSGMKVSKGQSPIAPNGKIKVIYGSDQTFTITPSKGYIIKAIKLDDNLLDLNIAVTYVGSSANYILSNITDNHMLKVVFAKEK